ncbi:augmin complex subunit msd1 [Drosophila sulfurigaster albostrigata]|uniref:augmin complex subunit msd1 n=1 Tax=Drosophila sulfurigaster albostrigata TaxID=89887 RepID=UPI002D21B98C|nr:augmin complex subunit msd1 [Drosophila sulfurigaster albostrigata]
MSEAIDEMLAGLAATRQTMQRQVAKISEIMEKSNKTLLHLETQNNLQTTISSPPPTTTDEGKNVYNFKPDCEQSIVKILEQFQQLMQQTVGGDHNQVGGGSLDDCLVYRQRAEYLGSSVRKLVAFCDSMNQLKFNLQEQEELAEADKENDEEF